jgi:imidazolonepropionase-like amidohydrolase
MRTMKMESRRGLIVAGVLCAGLPLIAACGGAENTQAPEGADVTAFEGARLIVGDESAPIENATFLVRDGQITEVGSTGEIQVPDGATLVNLAGKTVIPGIIDTHTHLRTDARETLIEDLQRRAYYGVVATASLGREVGDVPYQIREEAVLNASRFRFAGRGITMPEPGRSDVPFWVTTEAEARQAIQELAELNVDIVKIWVDDRNGMYMKLTPELYGAIIDEAHMNGLRVTAHIFNLEDAKGLLRAGLDAFAHGVRDLDIDDEVVELFGERPDVVLVPNLPNRGVATDLSWVSETVPAGMLEKLQAAATDQPEAQEAFGLQARNLTRLSAAGVVVGLGTDGNTPYGAHLEMEDMVAAGMSPQQVIVAATRNSADLLNLTDLGTVEAGKSADFVVLDANPLDDITNSRSINAVYMRGALVDRAGLRAGWAAGAAGGGE